MWDMARCPWIVPTFDPVGVLSVGAGRSDLLASVVRLFDLGGSAQVGLSVEDGTVPARHVLERRELGLIADSHGLRRWTRSFSH